MLGVCGVCGVGFGLLYVRFGVLVCGLGFGVCGLVCVV